MPSRTTIDPLARLKVLHPRDVVDGNDVVHARTEQHLVGAQEEGHAVAERPAQVQKDRYLAIEAHTRDDTPVAWLKGREVHMVPCVHASARDEALLQDACDVPLVRTVHADLGEVLITDVEAPQEAVIRDHLHGVALGGTDEQLAAFLEEIKTLLVAGAHRLLHVGHRTVQGLQVPDFQELLYPAEAIWTDQEPQACPCVPQHGRHGLGDADLPWHTSAAPTAAWRPALAPSAAAQATRPRLGLRV
mmetsp:Transcript_74725/g.241618  ORF Transcript_74725/g.241618 Transcript_74725/m.241618 type:complete len:246 (-) Transcript_74725:1356-2093(-)